jgi:uncharacterized protein
MGLMEVTVTGASGLIGRALVSALIARGEGVTALSRDPKAARAKLPAGVRAERWDPLSETAPHSALEGRQAIVHLAGEPIDQRWSEPIKQAIQDSRVKGTANLVAGLRAVEPGARPNVMVSSSAIGYYGQHGVEPIDEEAPCGNDFLAEVCERWEAEARAANELGLRTIQLRTGVVLDREGGALAKMLPPFRLGLGGPIAGGHQYVAWIHRDDLVGMMLTALADERWAGPFNATAPEPATNRELAHALGAALHRPAILPVPEVALRALYGEMAQIVTTGVRAVPAKALVLGYQFAHPELRQALAAALS